MRLGHGPREIPLANRRHVRRLSVNPSGTEVVIGQKAHGKHRSLYRLRLPDFAVLPGPDPCPLAADQDVCNVLVHGGDDIVVAAGLAEQRLSLLDLTAGTTVSPVDGEVKSAAMAGHLLAVTGADTKIVDWKTGAAVWQPDPPGWIDSDDYDPPVPIIAFATAGNSFAVGGWGNDVVDVYSLDTFEIAVRLSGAPPRIRWLGYSPDDEYLLAIAPSTGAVTVWRKGETEPYLPDVFGSMDYSAAAFHPDGEHCAMGMWSGALGVHRLSDGASVEARMAHNGGLNALDFTPDGTLLLTGGDDGKLLVWDVET